MLMIIFILLMYPSVHSKIMGKINLNVHKQIDASGGGTEAVVLMPAYLLNVKRWWKEAASLYF